MRIDRAAVVAGGVRAGIVAGLAIVAAQAIKSLTGADASPVLYLVLLGGLVVGGRVAGLRQPTSPLTHGALAALSAYVVLLVVVTGVRLALGRDVANLESFVFNALVAASAGILGGYLAQRRQASPA